MKTRCTSISYRARYRLTDYIELQTTERLNDFCLIQKIINKKIGAKNKQFVQRTIIHTVKLKSKFNILVQVLFTSFTCILMQIYNLFSRDKTTSRKIINYLQ